jgi:hypothetical protein
VRVSSIVALAWLAAGCTPLEPPAQPEHRSDALTASGVTVRLPTAGGGLVARARSLELDPGGLIRLSGDASVTLDAGIALDARAERIAIDGSAGRAVLEGHVRARLEATPATGASEGDPGADR